MQLGLRHTKRQPMLLIEASSYEHRNSSAISLMAAHRSPGMSSSQAKPYKCSQSSFAHLYQQPIHSQPARQPANRSSMSPHQRLIGSWVTSTLQINIRRRRRCRVVNMSPLSDALTNVVRRSFRLDGQTVLPRCRVLRRA